MGNWKACLRAIEPYVPGFQPKELDILKLNANENPYPPSPKVLAALAALPAHALRRYPNNAGDPFRQALANYHGLTPGQVFLGNGSDDVLALAYQAFFYQKERPILFPDVTYSFYPVWCRMFDVPFETVPVDEAFRVRWEDFARPNGGILLPNPNAPTGIGEDLEFLRKLLASNQDSVVIIDEAYVDFGGQTALPLLKEFDNLLIVRTFSKCRSLAGARIGAAFGGETLISVLDAVKNSYNSYTIDGPAIAIGMASLADEAYFREHLQKLIHTRDAAAKSFQALGFSVCPSQANFLFVSHPRIPATTIYQGLAAQGVYVRHFALPRIENYLRVSIGTDADMARLFTALQKVFNTTPRA